MNKASDLLVITKTKLLCSYIFTITQKSPKQFRFSIVAKLQNYALEAIEQLYRANDMVLNSQNMMRREQCQRNAMTAFRLLGYMAELGSEQGAILPKQLEKIAKQLSDCRNCQLLVHKVGLGA